ncbi:SRPBCC family protein [Streptomyces sp. NPDC053427]|uniref:SRPBCC family protein n=1 Tax=Streptomyces sp. NPDC053427 TaxID=3365701 RepID=UPI0037D291AE
MSTTVSRTILIAAQPDKLLSTLRDIAAYPDWQQDVETAEVLEADELARPSRARMVLSAIGKRVEQILVLEHTDRELKWSLAPGHEKSLISRNDTEFRLVETGDGSTELTVRQEFEFNLKLPRTLARRIVERRSASMVRQFKEAAEA